MERASTSQIPQSVGKQGEALSYLGIYMVGLLSKVKEGRPINLSIQEKQELHKSYKKFQQQMDIFLKQDLIHLSLSGESDINDSLPLSSQNSQRTHQIQEKDVEENQQIILGSLINEEQVNEYSRKLQDMQLNQNLLSNILKQINNKEEKEKPEFSIYTCKVQNIIDTIEKSKSAQEQEKQKVLLQKHLKQIQFDLVESKDALQEMIKRIEIQYQTLVTSSSGLIEDELISKRKIIGEQQQKNEEELKSGNVDQSTQINNQNWATAFAQNKISSYSHILKTFNNNNDKIMRRCGDELIYEDDEQNVEVMNLNSLTTTKINIQQNEMQNCLKCSNERHLLISTCDDETVRIIDREEGMKEVKAVDLKSRAQGMQEWDDQNIILGLWNAQLWILNLTSFKTTLLVQSKLWSIYDIVKCKRGGYLAIGGSGGVEIGVVGNDFSFHFPPKARSIFCEGKKVASLIAFGENQLCAAVWERNEELVAIVNVEEGTEKIIPHPSKQKDNTFQVQLVDRNNGVAIVRTSSDLFLLNLDTHQIIHSIKTISHHSYKLDNCLKLDTKTHQFYLQIFIIETDNHRLKRLDLKRNLPSF